MTEEEIFEAEWALIQILAHPVLFREFINEDTPGWIPLERHERQWSTCDNHFVSMCCGRGVHKTTGMIEMLYYWVINYLFVPGDPGLFVVVPNKAQKDLAFFKIRSACLTHWLIRQYANPNAINITEGKIEFRNGFQFLLRIAGASGSDANVIGVHTLRIWVDEAQEFPWQTWQSLQNCLKQEIDGYQLFVSGVPNGSRQENVLFHTDQESEKYVPFNVSQAEMSWWTPELELETRKAYHAVQEDSEDYKHYVLGQHGVPSFAVFDRNRFVKEDHETTRLVYTQQMFDRVKRIDPDGHERIHIEEVIHTPPLPYTVGFTPRVGLGYDVGFSPDPAVFFVMYETNTGAWKNLIRVVLERVEYPIQREVLAWLDKIYQFSFMGIDMGGPGKVQYQDLTGELNQYKQFKFKDRLHPVEFGGYMTVALGVDDEEKKDQTKKVAVESLSRWVHDGKFVFAQEDTNLMDELERTKFTRTITGEPVYRTENDHQMAAMMCAILAYESKFGAAIVIQREPLKVKLMSASWFDPTNSFGD